MNVAIGKENSSFEVTINNVEENKASCNEVVTGTKTKVETQSKLMTEKKNTKFKEAVDQNKTDINIVGESVKEFIEETKTTDSDRVSSLVDSVSDVSLNAKW